MAPGNGGGTRRAPGYGRMARGRDPRETSTRKEQVAMSGHRGQGRAYLPAKQRGHGRSVYMLDWTVDGCTCGTCDRNGRHRESSGTDDYNTAVRILEQRREDRRIGRPVSTAAPTPTTLQAYVAIYLKKKEGKVTAQSLKAITLHLERAGKKLGAERQLA